MLNYSCLCVCGVFVHTAVSSLLQCRSWRSTSGVGLGGFGPLNPPVGLRLCLKCWTRRYTGEKTSRRQANQEELTKWKLAETVRGLRVNQTEDKMGRSFLHKAHSIWKGKWKTSLKTDFLKINVILEQTSLWPLKTSMCWAGLVPGEQCLLQHHVVPKLNCIFYQILETLVEFWDS